MAQKLDTFPQGSQATAYPLDDWLDGSAWKLLRGEDFDQSTASLRSLLSTGAKAKGMRLRTRSRKEGEQEVLFIQAYRDREPTAAGRRSKRGEESQKEASPAP